MQLFQTIAVTCFGLGVSCYLYGLQTLNIKETKRLIALKNELTKLGANLDITESSLKNARLTAEESAKNIYAFLESDFNNGTFWDSERSTQLGW